MLTRDIHTFSMAPVLTIAASNSASFLVTFFPQVGHGKATLGGMFISGYLPSILIPWTQKSEI